MDCTFTFSTMGSLTFPRFENSQLWNNTIIWHGTLLFMFGRLEVSGIWFLDILNGSAIHACVRDSIYSLVLCCL